MEREENNRVPNCYRCKKEIWFSDEPEFVSSNGKKIPLTKINGVFHKHRCENNPYNRNTRRAYYNQQQEKTPEEKLAEEQELKERHRKWKEEQAQHEDKRKKYNDKDKYDIPAELDSILRYKKTAEDGFIISDLTHMIYGPCTELEHKEFSSMEKKLQRIMGQIRREACQKWKEEGIKPDFLPYAQAVLGERHVWKYFNAIDFIENQIKLHKSKAEGLQYMANLLGRMYEIDGNDDDNDDGYGKPRRSNLDELFWSK